MVNALFLLNKFKYKYPHLIPQHTQLNQVNVSINLHPLLFIMFQLIHFLLRIQFDWIIWLENSLKHDLN